MTIYRIVNTDWSNLFQKLKQYTIEHSPQILTGVGLSTIIGAGVIAVKNTPAACKAIENKKLDDGVDKLSFWDIIKVGFKYYVVPAGMTVVGATCILSGLRVSENRKDAFAALAASEAIRLKDQRDVVREKFGEKKAQEVDDEVAKREVDRAGGIPNAKLIEQTGHGDQIVYWPLLSRWFQCDIGWIRRIENEINRDIEDGDVNENDPYDTRSLNGVALNRFIAGIGLSKCDLGILLGWNGKNRLHIRFTDAITGNESEKAPVLVMHMDDCMPREKWDSVRQDKPQYIAPF